MANYVSTYSGAQIDSAVGLANKAVITDSQSLTDAQKTQARTNISAVTKTALSCTLPTSGWSSNTITVPCPGITSSDDIQVAPAPASHEEYVACGIYCTACGTNTLTFKRLSENENALSVNVMKWS